MIYFVTGIAILIGMLFFGFCFVANVIRERKVGNPVDMDNEKMFWFILANKDK